jgi:hypothetical protein
VNQTFFSNLVDVAGIDLTTRCVDKAGLIKTIGKGEGVSNCYSPLPDGKERAKILIAHDEWLKSMCKVLSAIKKVCNSISTLVSS